MKVKCINPINRLRKDEVYDVIRAYTEDGDRYYDLNVRGDEERGYYQSRFEIIKEEKEVPQFVRIPDIKYVNGGRNAIICNQHDETAFKKQLKNEPVIYIAPRSDYTGLHIEEAVKLRDWLNDLIAIAESTGYFNVKELTVDEISKLLGYKVKVVGNK